MQPYRARFVAPEGPTFAGTLGRLISAAAPDAAGLSADLAQRSAQSEAVAGEARALQDRAAIRDMVQSHGALTGAAAVFGQPDTLGAMADIAARGRDALGSPTMVAAYDKAIAPVLADASARITAHALNSADVERAALRQRILADAQDETSSDWNDPARFVAGLGRIAGLADAVAGLDARAGDRAVVVNNAVGGAVAGALRQALDAGDTAIAGHIISGWGRTLDPATYQDGVARLGAAAQATRMRAIFADAASGGQTAASAPGNPDAFVLAAPAGAAIHPIASGVVRAIDGEDANRAVTIAHPDGSATVIAGLGQIAVAPGAMVTRAHVIGSAGPVVTLSGQASDGTPIDAASLMQAAGGDQALTGSTEAPRAWDIPAMLARIDGRSDLTGADRALAHDLALRRMVNDSAQLAANDLAAGRVVARLIASNGPSPESTVDLPDGVKAGLSPTTLAQVDAALRSAAYAPAAPAADGPAALRLELLQRRDPGAFGQINLAPLVGSIAPQDLDRLAGTQDALAHGQALPSASDMRSAILDSIARHEFSSGSVLPDAALPAVLARANAALRMGGAEPTDRAASDAAVSSAIQTLPDAA